MRMLPRAVIVFAFSVAALVVGLVPAPNASAQAASFRRGDANADARLDLSDAVFTLHSLFLGGAGPRCADAADANDDGNVDISDALYTLINLYLGGPAPPAPGFACGTDPTSDALGCDTYEPCDIVHGASEFATPLAGGPGGVRGGVDDAGGPPTPGANPPPAGPPTTPDRVIEESDIYKLSGNLLYVMNRYRGLQILDLADFDHPHLIGRAPIFGYPKEMYVRGNTAYVLVSDYYTFWRDDTTPGISVQGFYGSQLRILDVSDPRNPRVVGGINLAGDCSDSRIVGDVMYLVAHRYAWYSRYGSTDTVDTTQILSVKVADPTDVRVIDTQDFPLNGWEHHISVTSETIYLASSGWIWDGQGRYETNIRYIDISDPAGAIRIRGEASVQGRVQDRWSFDEFDRVLRVASGQSWGNGDVFITTFSVDDPDNIRQLGKYVLNVSENLTAARFDGPRAYLVSYRRIDPLFTFDLSNPAKPALLGELKMTGWLDFIVPMGDRLVALGHEDLTNPQGQRTISLAVSLIDVSKQTAPQLLSRVSLDGVWGWVPASADDFAKVFRTLPDQGLILFPFQAWSPTDYRYVGGVQLIDYNSTTLTRRGLIGNAGWVERGIPDGDSTVITLSSEIFQVMDISDRDSPRLRSRLELARDVQSFAPLPDNHAVQLSGDWYRGDTTLTVTTLDDPDTVEPAAQLHIPAPYARMFPNGSLVYLSSLENVLDDAGNVTQRVTKVQVIDLSDPLSPRIRGSVKLPEEVMPGYGAWYWGWGDEAVQVNGTTLAFHHYPFFWRGCFDCPVAVDAAAPGGDGVSQDHKVYLVDLADPDSPRLASTVVLDNADWAWGLKASGSTLYLSFYRAFQDVDQWMARYFLDRIDVSDPASPVVRPEVNIPGVFIDASADGLFAYTLETWWDNTGQKPRTLFHALALDGDKAFLQSSVELDGYASGVQVKDGAAFAVTEQWNAVTVDGGGQQWYSTVDLVTIDLADAQAIRLAGKASVPIDYAYLQKVEDGRAFIGSGAGIFTYTVKDLSAPTFEEFFRTQGWSQDIIVVGDRAFVPSGFYGVQVLELGGGK